MENQENIIEYAAHIDVASCGCGVIYVVGWAFNGRDTDSDVEIYFQHTINGKRIQIPVQRQRRNDINKHFGLDNALCIGFSTQERLNDYGIDGLPPGKYQILIKIVSANNSCVEIEGKDIDIIWPENIPAINGHCLNKSVEHEICAAKQGFLSKIWNGSIGKIIKQVDEVIFSDNLTGKGLIAIADARVQIGPELASIDSPLVTVANLMHSAGKHDGFVIMFDHNFGGGANVFSEQLLSQIDSNHNVMLRVWYEPNGSKVMGSLHYLDSEYPISIGSIKDLFDLLCKYPSTVVHVNTLFAWPYIERILDNLVRLRIYRITKKIHYYAHDHMAICPSLFLMNETDEYCGVPEEVRRCSTCLKKNKAPFKVFYKQEDVIKWRKGWCSFLINCDYIRFFSEATKKEYSKAYPNLLDWKNAMVDPHDVSIEFAEKLEAHASDGVTRIGVFGFIDKHKGADSIIGLAKDIRRSNDGIEIHIFGSLGGVTSGSDGIIFIHGEYNRKNMVGLLNEQKIDLVFMPSICPETFSFVIAEVIKTGIKLVVFDLGAQADAARKYVNGVVIPRSNILQVKKSLLLAKSSSSVVSRSIATPSNV